MKNNKPRPFVCPHCQEGFTRKDILNDHLTKRKKKCWEQPNNAQLMIESQLPLTTVSIPEPVIKAPMVAITDFVDMFKRLQQENEHLKNEIKSLKSQLYDQRCTIVHNTYIDNSVNTVDNSVNTVNNTNLTINNAPQSSNELCPDLIGILDENHRIIPVGRNSQYSEHAIRISTNQFTSKPLLGHDNGGPLRNIIVSEFVNPGKYTTLAELCSAFYFNDYGEQNYCIYVVNNWARMVKILHDGKWNPFNYCMDLFCILMDKVSKIVCDVYAGVIIMQPGELQAYEQYCTDMRQQEYIIQSMHDFYSLARLNSYKVSEYIKNTKLAKKGKK